MDQTTPFNIPYPECNPPLAEDAADIQHMQTMALGIDAAVQSVATPADDNWISPDAANMGSESAQTLFTGSEIVFNFVIFDNAGLADVANNQFIIRQTGFYAVSGSVFGTPGIATTTWFGLQLSVNSVISGVRGISYTSQTVETGPAFLAQLRLNEGDQVTFIYDGQVDLEADFSRAALCRIA